MKETVTLRLILGDQLNLSHSWLKTTDKNTIFVLMEMRQETDYVCHHIQKVVGFFAAMRRFAQQLAADGHRVKYYKINDEDNTQSLTQNLQFCIDQYQVTHFEYQLPDEYRLDKQLKSFCQQINISSKAIDTEHFLTTRTTVADQFEGKKMWLMENFYRKIRQKYALLMESDGQPTGGQWNFDADNRKKWTGKPALPLPLTFKNNCQQEFDDILKSGAATFGNINANEFGYPVTRSQAIEVLTFFTEKCLPFFGSYEDAMTVQSGTLFHSRLSFALNIKLLSPLEVVQAAVAAWEIRKEEISLSQVEGFVRQIIGWREYVRGIYWAKMPDYVTKNFFGNTRKLPQWFWTGDTKMRCQREAVQHSLDHAYAHHIQRLMVTGNFTSLAGIAPDDVDAWYLGIYIDALEWVELPNTRGMSQFADGGIVGTKPYVASANYMHKMSDYCTKCDYKKDLKVGKDACPLNSLYWHFYERNRTLLEKNPRIGMMYIMLNKMDGVEKSKIMAQAEYYLENIETL